MGRHPQHLIDKALQRADYLRRWRDACKSGNTTDRAAERIVAEARRVGAGGLKLGVRSLYGWLRRYNRLGPDGKILGVEGLVDRYGSINGRVGTRSPEATELFFSVFRTENKLSVAASHEVTLHESRRRGWQWPASYRANTSWLDKNDDRSMRYLLRNGRVACPRLRGHVGRNRKSMVTQA